MLDNKDFSMRVLAFMASVNRDIKHNLKLSEGALKNGDEDAADYYATCAIAQNQIYDNFVTLFDDFLPVSDIAIASDDDDDDLNEGGNY